MDQPILLCGLGRVGSRVLEYLRAAGLPVVVLDTTCSADDPRLAGTPLISGDCRRPEVLEQAGVRRAAGVLILTSDDLVNISTALLVRNLNREVRVVIRMFNQNLLTRLGRAVHNVAALSTSTLTAPLLALTALTGQALGTFRIDGLPRGRRQVVEIAVAAGSPLLGRRVSEVLAGSEGAVLAHLPAKGTQRFLLDVEVTAALALGDRLVVCGEPRHLTHLLAEAGEEALPHLRWAGVLRRLGRVAWQTVTEVDLPVKVATGVLVGVILASTLVFHLGVHKYRFADAFYRTISVMATGADMHAEEFDSPWQKVFASILRIVGAALTAAFTAIVTNYLLRARLNSALEVRRIPDSGHIIVCGLGNIGFRVVEEIISGNERVVVIERSRDGRFVGTARRLGAAVILGDATVREVLRQAHAADALAVVAATGDDLVNLEVALLVRELNPTKRVVLRLSDPFLAQTLREAANVRFALSVPGLAAPAFVAALFNDRVLSVFHIEGRLLAVVELTVSADDPFFRGQPLRALSTDYRLLPLALFDPDQRPCPAPLDECLRSGDRLTAIATLSDLERLLRRETVPRLYAVDVTAVPDSARPGLVTWLRETRGLDSHIAESTVAGVPFILAEGLTRGHAEHLLWSISKEQVSASLRRSDENPGGRTDLPLPAGMQGVSDE